MVNVWDFFFFFFMVNLYSNPFPSQGLVKTKNYFIRKSKSLMIARILLTSAVAPTQPALLFSVTFTDSFL